MRLTAVGLPTDPRPGDLASVLVHAPTLPPVALLLPVVAVLVAAGDESPLDWRTQTQTGVRYGPARHSARDALEMQVDTRVA